MGGLDVLIQKRRSADGWPRMESFRFDDKASRLVQTADLLAYEYVKRVREWDAKPIRDSLKNLVPGGRIMPLVEPILKQIARLPAKFKAQAANNPERAD